MDPPPRGLDILERGDPARGGQGLLHLLCDPEGPFAQRWQKVFSGKPNAEDRPQRLQQVVPGPCSTEA